MKEGDFTVTVWKQLKYLQKGVSHVRNSTNCQDSVLIFENDNCIVAALADGLGSLKYSEVAAQTATETVCKCFLELSNPLVQFETKKDLAKKDLAKHILDASVVNIQNKAREMGIPLNEMDCTLMFVCVLKTTNHAIIGRLGDSAVCVIANPKSIAINDGNKSANGTNAILDKDAIEHFDIQIIDLDKNNIQGFILSSDGLENELYMKGSDHVNKNAELYFNAWFKSDDPVTVIEERIIELTKIEGTPFDDDIGIAVLSRADNEITLPADPKWLCTCGFRNPLQATYCHRCHKDFSVLYQNIRFRDYGGKAAFFTEINKKPEEELRIIGMRAKSDVVKQDNPIVESDFLKIPQTKSSDEKVKKHNVIPLEPVTNKREKSSENENQENVPPRVEKVKNVHRQASGKHTGKTNKSRYDREALKAIGILMTITLVIGLVAGGTFVKIVTSGKMSKLSKNIDELTKKVNLYEVELAEKEMQSETLLPEDFSVLEDGSYYWGTVDNLELPNGFGIMKIDDEYYIGNFEHGKKDGEFSIVDSNRVCRVEKYIEDELVSVEEVPVENEAEYSNQFFSAVQ